MRLVEVLGLVFLCGLLACAVVIVLDLRAVRARLASLVALADEGAGGLRRLIADVSKARIDDRKDRQSARQIDAVYRKGICDDLRGCRDSIDAIRTVTDEHSEHRRDTVEMRPQPEKRASPSRRDEPPETVPETGRTPAALPASHQRPATSATTTTKHSTPRLMLSRGEPDIAGDRDSGELFTRVLPGTADPGQRAAGLGRPKSPRAALVAEGPHRLPTVLPPPVKGRTAATLPSMVAVSPGAEETSKGPGGAT